MAEGPRWREALRFPVLRIMLLGHVLTVQLKRRNLTQEVAENSTAGTWRTPTRCSAMEIFAEIELITSADKIVLLAKIMVLIVVLGWTAWYMHAVLLTASLFNLSLRSYTSVDWMKIAVFGVGPFAISVFLLIAKRPATNQGVDLRQR